MKTRQFSAISNGPTTGGMVNRLLGRVEAPLLLATCGFGGFLVVWGFLRDLGGPMGGYTALKLTDEAFPFGAFRPIFSGANWLLVSGSVTFFGKSKDFTKNWHGDPLKTAYFCLGGQFPPQNASRMQREVLQLL